MKTILKWAGSKMRMMSELTDHLPDGNRLVEPFAGSCSVMMNTDYQEYMIADINPDLIHLYKFIQNDVDLFIDEAKPYFDGYNNPESFYDLRSHFNLSSDPMDRAIIFLYLNRHCFNGLCRYNQRGDFNVPFGKYNSPYFPEDEIRAFADKAQRATFICASFEETLDMVVDGDVVYCDPPYLPESSNEFTSYHAEPFGYFQQLKLRDKLISLSDMGISCIASNNKNDDISSMYFLFQQIPLVVRRSCGAAANSRNKADELILKRGVFKYEDCEERLGTYQLRGGASECDLSDCGGSDEQEMELHKLISCPELRHLETVLHIDPAKDCQ